MDIDDVVQTVQGLAGTLILAPDAGTDFPEIAWGDFFFYYAPDGQVPTNSQPFATIVTKDYPDEPSSGLDPDGRWRVNVHVGGTAFETLTGQRPKNVSTSDFTVADTVLPHPAYASVGWVCVVNPAERTSALVLDLLRQAHTDARARSERRSGADQVS